jgi:hypothetical protein
MPINFSRRPPSGRNRLTAVDIEKSRTSARKRIHFFSQSRSGRAITASSTGSRTKKSFVAEWPRKGCALALSVTTLRLQPSSPLRSHRVFLERFWPAVCTLRKSAPENVEKGSQIKSNRSTTLKEPLAPAWTSSKDFSRLHALLQIEGMQVAVVPFVPRVVRSARREPFGALSSSCELRSWLESWLHSWLDSSLHD